MQSIKVSETGILPNEIEIVKWILHTATHAYHIEYFLQELQIGSEDPDRPHDIVHKGSKFDWEAVKGFALQFRTDKKKIDKEKSYFSQIIASRKYHRQQYHHRQWNQSYSNATGDAMGLGAVDAVCSLLEPREYQGGVHTYAQIEAIANKNPVPKKGWMKYAVLEMRKVKQPNLAEITAFSEIPRAGITSQTRDNISERIHQTLRMLEQDYGYHFYENSESYIRGVLK